MSDTTPKMKLSEYGYYELAEKPTPASLAEYYREQYYQHSQGNYKQELAKQDQEWLLLKCSEKAYLAEQINGIKKGRFLDIGCGQGWALRCFSEMGYQVTGMDFSTDGLKTHNPDLLDILVQGDLMTELSAMTETFDVILMENVLEHVLDPEQLLKLIKQRAHKDTVLVTAVPNDFSPLHDHLFANDMIDRKFWIAAPDHISYFSRKGLEKLSSSCGWATRKVIADYPIDINLLNQDSNYIMDASKGRSCHVARMELEMLLHKQGDMAHLVGLYEQMAMLGLGRNIISFMQLRD